MKTLEERLEQVEARLARIEQLLPAMPATRGADTDTPARAGEAAAVEPVPVSRPPVAAPSPTRKMA
ncbi:MAG: hypothetical protein WCB97_12810, partial [Thiobacillus sp.]